MKKWWVKLLLVLVLVLLALSTWFFGSSGQSQNEVERYRQQLIAAGEKLDVDAFIPPHVDSDKNGAAVFDKACWYIAPRGVGVVSTNAPSAMELVATAKARVLWLQDEIVSVKYSRHATNSWAELEADLASQSSAVDLLQQAASYPDFDFGIDYHESSIRPPLLNKFRQAVMLLSAKVIDDLHRRETASAVTNFQALLVIANAVQNEPLLFSQTMRNYLMQSALATQWELLQATNLTDAQLAMLQTNWTDVDFVKPEENAFQMSRCLVGVTMKAMRASGVHTSYAGSPSASFGSGGFDGFGRIVRSMKTSAGDAFWRESWGYDDEVRMLEGNSVMVGTLRQAETNGYFKDALAERERQIIALGLDHTNASSLRTFLGGQALEFDVVRSVRSYALMIDRLVAAEAWRQCTITAIALKRYELRHGAVPKGLNALVPEFLSKIPADPMDGHPLRYRLNADGTFLLYSIGADGIDSGGDATAVPSTASYYLQMQSGRDWVWPQPATPPEVKNYYDHPPK